MKRIVLFTLSLFALASFGAVAQDGTLKKVKDSGAITIGHRDASIPFSYYDDKQQPIGYAMDLCHKIVDAVKAELKMPALKVNYQLVTSANRIPLMANGTIDLECGSTTNNNDRQKQVSFGMTYFVVKHPYVAKKSAGLNTIADLKGKTVVSTAGTTNLKELTELNAQRNLGMSVLSANGHPESFLMVETGRAAAFFMDDILLYGLVATSKNPAEFSISSESVAVEPYSLMLRKDDPEFKKLVDATMSRIFKGGEINAIYDKWFLKPIPPKGVNLNVPMSAALKKVFANPTDSGDPKVYE